MNKLIVVSSALMISACVPEKPALIIGGMGNPASIYCIERGGVLETVTTDAGEHNLCHLPDGTKPEEWELYRANHKS